MFSNGNSKLLSTALSVLAYWKRACGSNLELRHFERTRIICRVAEHKA